MRIIGDLVLAGFGQLKNARIENLSTDPGSPQNGQVWFNTTDNVYRGFNGTDVITFATGGNTATIIAMIEAETTARIAADAALQSAIDAETTARTSADDTLTAAVAAETTARQAADATLQSNLDAETTARTNADSTLQANIDAETTARTNADNTLTSNLNTEITARTNADNTLQANIDAEATARTEADNSIRTDFAAADSSIRTDFAAADTTLRSDLEAALATEASTRAAADDLRVLKAGDSMTGNLAFGGVATVTGVTAPVNASDVATKNYVDSSISGLSWKQAVDNVGTATPGTATTGDRFLNTTDGKIYTATAADTWDSGVAAVDGDAVFDRATETGYVYSGVEWTQFTGTGQVAAGVGLSKTGNQIDVNLGAGIAQLPSDEVGIDVRATGGLWLTLDGVEPTTHGDAQLAVRLADASLELGANGLQMAAGLQTELSAATSAIAAETTARIAADAAETSAREAADSALTTALATETTARTNADATLQSNLDAETTARTAADAVLQAAIDAEATARTNADNALTSALDAETTARTSADATLQANLDAEATARAAAIAAETSAREAADSADSARLTNSHFVYDGSVAATSHTVTHNLGVKYCQVIVVDSNDKVIIPDAITFTDSNSLVVDFISAITCKVAVTAPKAL
jgi:hypothetical protein